MTLLHYEPYLVKKNSRADLFHIRFHCDEDRSLSLFLSDIGCWRVSNWSNYLLSLFLTGRHLFCVRRSTRLRARERETNDVANSLVRETARHGSLETSLNSFLSYVGASWQGDMNFKRKGNLLCLTSLSSSRSRSTRIYIYTILCIVWPRSCVCVCVIKLIVMFIYILWHTNELSSCAASFCSL